MARLYLRRLAVIVMMAAAGAFTLQATFVAMSEAATGDTSHYYQGFALRHALGGAAHSHVVTHMHADGIVHRHAVDDGALDDHVKQRGWNMAVVVGVLPCPTHCTIATVVGSKLGPAMPSPLQVADQDGLRKPPRPSRIA
jgi:ABC-type nickel/cobalt efflux system permease component RcnA